MLDALHERKEALQAVDVERMVYDTCQDITPAEWCEFVPRVMKSINVEKQAVTA